MAEYGIVESGFIKKSYNIILDELIASWKASLGDDFDFREATPQKQIVSIEADKIAELWDMLEDLYNQRLISLSNNNALSYNVRSGGIRRNQATKSSGQITISGTNGTIIAVGFQVATDDNIIFQTTNSATIASGTATLTIEAVNAGSQGNVAASTITRPYTNNENKPCLSFLCSACSGGLFINSGAIVG